MKKFALFIAAVLFATFGFTAPANAGWPGGQIWHASDDSGYNPPIYFRCDNGYVGSLNLGVSSKRYCGDAEDVYVAPNTHIDCRHNDGRWQRFSAPGWHNGALGNWTVINCYQKVDTAIDW